MCDSNNSMLLDNVRKEQIIQSKVRKLDKIMTSINKLSKTASIKTLWTVINKIEKIIKE